jgi:hypothetical protein
VRPDLALFGMALAVGGLLIPLLSLFSPGRLPTEVFVTIAAGAAGIVAAVRERYGISAGVLFIAGAAEIIWAPAGAYPRIYAQLGGLLFLFAGLAMVSARADER